MEEQKVVLISVVGMSPAVVTETIWALHTEEPAFVPDEVKLFTTRKAWENASKALLSRENGRSIWDELQQKIGKEMILKKHIFEDLQGGELEDIVTDNDQELVADQLLKGVREYKNPQQEVCRVVASLAGGRKSMSALMYAVMSLAAEADDMITHVLADEQASACRNFFFPEQECQQLTAKINGQEQPFTAADVRLSLAAIPFVPLASLVKNSDFDASGSFSRLVEKTSRVVAKVGPAQTQIRISKSQCKVFINDNALLLTADQFVLMAIMAEYALTNNNDADVFIPDAKTAYDMLRRLKKEGKLPASVLHKIKYKELQYLNSKEWKKRNEKWTPNSPADVEKYHYSYPDTHIKVKHNLKEKLERRGFHTVANDALPNKKIGFNLITNIQFID